MGFHAKGGGNGMEGSGSLCCLQAVQGSQSQLQHAQQQAEEHLQAVEAKLQVF